MEGKEPRTELRSDTVNSDGARNYRDRIYGQYVSAFKGQPAPDLLKSAAQEHARFFDHLFKQIMDAARPEDVLEVGCGRGNFLYWAVKRGFKSVSGFDFSPEQVAAARQLGLPAEVASFQDYLSGRSEAFDLIVALDIIEHLTRDEVFSLLDLCHNALRPGGYIFLTTPNGAALRPGPVMYGDLTHETFFSPQTASLVLRLTGFESIHVREIVPAPTSFRSRVRGMLWQVLRLWPMLLDVVEKGTYATHVYSRVMSIEARRPGVRS